VKDVDNGLDRDIFDINEDLGLDLFEGDIILDEIQERNAIVGERYRWPHTIPYVLDESLEMNARGVILKAFERYRLKSCIDFKPWSGEPNYISVFKGNGCWSSVGKQLTRMQQLSIGEGCDKIATVQHEFLHALGFWHEQSRSDRDDYVSIIWDRIISGKERNFDSYNDQVIDSMNVPYDYSSVMHYSKTAFGNGSEPTIITRVPDFMDVIGQRMDFSDSDVLKLNQLYNCCSGFFMHFNSSSVNKGATAILESRILYPKRGFQCLQFFLYNSGSQDDQLNIYVREYSAAHVSSTLTLVEQIKDNGTYFWDRPSKVGAQVIFPNGTQFQRGRGRGFPNFMTQEMLKSRDFIKGDDVYILLTVEDISHLNAQNYPLPTLDVSDLCTSFRCENDGICILQNGRAECRCRSGDDWWYMGERCEKRGSTRDTIVIAISSTAAVFALMLIITLVSVYCTRKKYRKESSSRTVNTIMENVS
ncbi:hypothetical protein G4228_016830, partial [Cervus hanglu yarkandensis]